MSQPKQSRTPSRWRTRNWEGVDRVTRKFRSTSLLPVSTALTFALQRVLRRRPQLLSRLGEAEGRTIRIRPNAFPVVFLIRIDSRGGRVEARPAADPGEADASVEASLETLLDVFEGRADGDAAFFSSDLWIDGDTASVLSLRNALEEAELSLSDLLPLPLPPVMEAPFSAALRGVGRRFA